jgi:hypothetical protein
MRDLVGVLSGLIGSFPALSPRSIGATTIARLLFRVAAGSGPDSLHYSRFATYRGDELLLAV